MAHPINDFIDRKAGGFSRKCDNGCKNYKFEHTNCPCVLSDVYSVNKGEQCYIYEPKEGNNAN